MSTLREAIYALLENDADDGVEICDNITCDDAGEWTLGTGWSIGTYFLWLGAAGVGTATHNPSAGIVAGRTYRVVYRTTFISGGKVTVSVGGTAGTKRDVSGTYTEDIVASSTDGLVFTPDAGIGSSVFIDDVSIKDCDAGNLFDLLGEPSASPYNCYFRNPPESFDFSGGDNCLTYFFSGMVGRFPREIYLNVTAWGDNYETVMNRVYDLLHKASLTTTDYSTLVCLWDYAGSELWADDFKVYYQLHRFLIKGIVT